MGKPDVPFSEPDMALLGAILSNAKPQAPRRRRFFVALEYVCYGCGWSGEEPAFDAHLSAYCPRCDKLAEFKAVAEKLGRWPLKRDDEVAD